VGELEIYSEVVLGMIQTGASLLQGYDISDPRRTWPALAAS
jgi:hypothetical protein